MKTLATILLALAMTAMYGCQSNSSRGGSVLEGKGFSIAVPTFTTEIKQGETQSVAVSLNRGEYFKQDVKMKIKASKGISVEPTKETIKANDMPDMKLMIAVAPDAALGEYSVVVKGVPDNGESTSTSFNVKVIAP